MGEKQIETAYYSTLVKVALNKDSESADPVQNLDQVMLVQFYQAMMQNFCQIMFAKQINFTNRKGSAEPKYPQFFLKLVWI